MQNIPSHADDIRHMFRASPSKHEVRNCSEENGVVSVSLPNIYIVHTLDGDKPVDKLNKGDKVILIHDGSSVTMKIDNIQKGNYSNGYVNIVYFVNCEEV